MFFFRYTLMIQVKFSHEMMIITNNADDNTICPENYTHLLCRKNNFLFPITIISLPRHIYFGKERRFFIIFCLFFFSLYQVESWVCLCSPETHRRHSTHSPSFLLYCIILINHHCWVEKHTSETKTIQPER